jgi:Homeodomain
MTVSPLSRTSSTASVWSVSDDGTTHPNIIRRTRKRFTNVQLTMLEDLFHQTSHPSREEREAVAQLGDMYVPHPKGRASMLTRWNAL